MSSAINMNYGYLQGYNNSFNMNQNVRPDIDGLVIKKNSNEINETSKNTSSDASLNKSDEENQKYSTGYNDNKLLASDEVINLAITKDMNKDKSLIGSESSLETLDVKKAISDMQRDKIIMEYQTFVSNPETDDGFVKKIR